MDIIILADFCGKMDGTGNSRFLYLANMLSKEHQVEILTSDFDHGSKSYFEKTPEGFPFKITMVHEGRYNRNVSLQRFAAHFIWSRSVKHYLDKRKKPDVIYAAIPPLTAPLEAAKYCEKNNIRFIIDVQDLWPEAFQMVFNVPILSDIVFLPFKWIANAVYKRADDICAVSETYVNRALAVNTKCRIGTTVFLGTDLAAFDQNVKNNPVSKPTSELWLGYCGSMGDSYDLECVIDAISMIEKPPVFVAIGDGQKRVFFETYAKEKNVKCIFTGMLPYEKMCGWLAACDMVVNPIVGASSASIINKHADYAASGLPVLNTQESGEYRKLVETYQMGYNCKNGDAKELAEKIETLIFNLPIRVEMGKNARKCAEKLFDRGCTYKKCIDTLICVPEIL